MSRVHLLTLGLAITSLTVAGCDDARTECELGETQACTCSDGTTGTQICTAAGEFSGCMCGTPTIDAGPGMDAGRDAGTDAGPDDDSGIIVTFDAGTDASTDTDGGTTDTDGGGTDSGTTDASTTTDAGTTPDSGTDGGGLGTDAGSDAGTTGTDGGSDAGPATSCDVTGFAPSTFQTVADDAAEFLIHRMTAASGDFLQLELYFAAGAMDTPHTATFTGENYATCDTCLLLVAGGAVYLAESGSAEFTSLSRTALTGTLTNVSLVEVTLDASNNSTPVVGGDVWCIPSLAFSGNAVGCGNGLCDTGENATSCAADCTGGCGDGVCTALTGGTETPGNCPADCYCELYGMDTCAGANRCAAAFTRDADDFGVIGVCGPAGSAGADAACVDRFSCASGLDCFGAPGSSTCDGPICDNFRHLTGAPSCGSGQGCFSFGPSLAEIAPIGFCDVTCDPFSTTGCSSGERCFPDPYSRDAGFCMPIGTTPLGGSCTAAEQCEFGAHCINFGAGGVCTPICEAGADSCGASLTCVAFVDESAYTGDAIERSYGRCAPSCGFDEGTPTCSAGSCVAGEIAPGTDDDVCLSIPNLAHGAACAGADFEFCNGLGVCFGGACTDLCRETAGAFNGGTHPDCPSGTVCLGEPGDVLATCGAAS